MSDVDRIAAILDEHELRQDSYCTCGYYVGVPSAYKWHLAGVLAHDALLRV